jgi:hypothetical protein
MNTLKKICTLLVVFLIFAISIGFAGLPVILSIVLGSWFWLFLYSIHVLSILFIGLCCLGAKESDEA